MASQPYRPQARRCRWLALGLRWRCCRSRSPAACRASARPPPLPTEPVLAARARRAVNPRLPADETRNRVAVLVPLTGRDAALGQSILNAANLALLDTGGAAHPDHRLRHRRAARSPAANEAIAEGNGLILGPLLAEDVRAVAPVARRADVPVIAFSNDVSVAGDGVYRDGLHPRPVDRPGRRLRPLARREPLRRAGAGQRLWRARRPGDDPGGRGRGRAAGRHPDLRRERGRRRAPPRPGSHAPGRDRRGADRRRAARRRCRPCRCCAAPRRSRACSPPSAGRPRAISAPMSACAAPGSRRRRTRIFNQFRTRYRARYNAAPFRLASLGYDAVLLAVRVAANWPVGRAFPARALRDPSGFAGVDGAFRFGRDGVAERALEVREVTATGHDHRLAGAARLQLTRTISARIASRSSMPRWRDAQALAVAREQALGRRAARPRAMSSRVRARQIDAFGEPQAHQQRLDAALGRRRSPSPRRCRGRCGRARRASSRASCGAAWRGRRAGRARRGRCRHRAGSASKRDCGGSPRRAGRGWRFRRREGRPPRSSPGSARRARRSRPDRRGRARPWRPCAAKRVPGSMVSW